MRFKICVTRNTKKGTVLYQELILSPDLNVVAVLAKVNFNLFFVNTDI